jgi:hypothetical protein
LPPALAGGEAVNASFWALALFINFRFGLKPIQDFAFKPPAKAGGNSNASA